MTNQIPGFIRIIATGGIIIYVLCIWVITYWTDYKGRYPRNSTSGSCLSDAEDTSLHSSTYTCYTKLCHYYLFLVFRDVLLIGSHSIKIQSYDRNLSTHLNSTQFDASICLCVQHILSSFLHSLIYLSPQWLCLTIPISIKWLESMAIWYMCLSYISVMYVSSWCVISC